jgi:hypothetical protein
LQEIITAEISAKARIEILNLKFLNKFRERSRAAPLAATTSPPATPAVRGFSNTASSTKIGTGIAPYTPFDCAIIESLFDKSDSEIIERRRNQKKTN